MAFKPIQYDDGQTVSLPVAATTWNKYDAMAYSSGVLTRATAGQGTDVTHVALETVSSAATANDRYLFLRVQGVVFEADTNADPVASTDPGTYADLTDHDTLDESTSSDDLFFIEDIVGATTDKKVRGWFVHGAPNS